SLHAHPRHPPFHHRCRPGQRRTRFRPRPEEALIFSSAFGLLKEDSPQRHRDTKIPRERRRLRTSLLVLLRAKRAKELSKDQPGGHSSHSPSVSLCLCGESFFSKAR